MRTRRFDALLAVTAAAALWTGGCASAPGPVHYTAQASVPETVAVAPVAVFLTGKAPRDFDADRVLQAEEAESVAFQIGLYDALMERKRPDRRHPILLDVQPVEVTNRLLEENGIGLRASWEMSTEELAAVLGVDTVLRSEVNKTRYLSNKASFGLEVVQEILHEASHDDDEHNEDDHHAGHPGPWAKTHDLLIDTALVDGQSGEVVWGFVVEQQINWTRRPNGIVREVSRKVAREFPYRG